MADILLFLNTLTGPALAENFVRDSQFQRLLNKEGKTFEEGQVNAYFFSGLSENTFGLFFLSTFHCKLGNFNLPEDNCNLGIDERTPFSVEYWRCGASEKNETGLTFFENRTPQYIIKNFHFYGQEACCFFNAVPSGMTITWNMTKTISKLSRTRLLEHCTCP